LRRPLREFKEILNGILMDMDGILMGFHGTFKI
jgi:hypothetical protein